MKVACFSFTDRGSEIGDKLQSLKDGKYNIDHYSNGDIDGGIKNKMQSIWNEYDGLIFISAVGIAMRMSVPYVKDKIQDPALVVVDDLGKFSISLLSGHLGGANQLAHDIADKLGAMPVITTATDNRNIESIDMFAKSNNYIIEDIKSLTKLTSMMVNGKTIALYTEDDKYINYKNTEIIKNLKDISSNIEGVIIVSSKESVGDIPIPFTILRPKNINIGIGCKKGVEKSRIVESIKDEFKRQNLSLKSIKAIATVEVKKDEKGIIESSLYFNCPLKIFSLDEIKAVEDNFSKSQFVKDTIGVYSVSGPVAFLLGGKMIKEKSKHNGITVSISKEVNNG